MATGTYRDDPDFPKKKTTLPSSTASKWKPGGVYATPSYASSTTNPTGSRYDMSGYGNPETRYSPSTTSYVSSAPALYPGAMGSDYEFLLPNSPGQTFPDLNPYPTNTGSYGTGSYGGGSSGLSTAEMQGIMDLIGKWKPDPYQFQDFAYTPAPRDTAQFDLMRGEVDTRKKRALTGVDQATEFFTKMLAGMNNPYAGGLRTQTPQMAQTTSTLLDPRSRGLVNQNVIDPLNNQSQMFDNGLAATNGMLSGAWDQSQQSRGLENQLNDYYYRNRAESDAGNMDFGIGMADAQDLAGYNRYVDQMNYGTAQGNWQGQNATSQLNTGTGNTARDNIVTTLLGLLSSGQMPDGFDMSQLEGMFA